MEKKIGFIGAGNMATAIINGMLKAGIAPDRLTVFDVDEEKCRLMADKGLNIADNGSDVMRESYYTVLAVKPQQLPTVLRELSTVCDESKVVVSIAAGISTEYLQKNLGVTCPCVRVMPNTPLLLGCGATALSKTDNVTQSDFDEVEEMFRNSGITAVISEDKMNAIISVNGSSPAYFYLFAKAMQEYAVEQGIDADTAMQLICATMKGSAEMLLKSGDDAQTLIKKVSSPGGTTLKALDVFYQNKTEQTIKDAMHACTERAIELAGE